MYKVFGRDPTTSEAKYSHRVTEIFAEEMFFNFIHNAIAPMACYVASLPVFPTVKIPDGSFEDLTRFAVISLEFANHLVDSPDLNVNFIDRAVDCASTILKEAHLCSILALDTHASWLCSAINSVYKLVNFLLLDGEPLPCLPRDNLRDTLGNLETVSAGHACYQASVLVEWLSKVQRKSVGIPKFLFKSIRSAVVSLARLPLVNSYVSIPPAAWKSGWRSELSGAFATQAAPLPLDHLQEVDVLEEFIFRTTLLGWTNRQQFEETWMCLLGVLCQAPSELEPQDANVATQATALAVQAITALLVQTLFHPLPSDRNVSRLLHVPRNRDVGSAGVGVRKLRRVQGVLCLKCEQAAGLVGAVVDVFDNGNLERVNGKYSYSQFSTEYLMVAAGVAEEFDGETAAAVVFKRRRRVLEESGLDINSCLQFLVDLYSQWTKNEVGVVNGSVSKT